MVISGKLEFVSVAVIDIPNQRELLVISPETLRTSHHRSCTEFILNPRHTRTPEPKSAKKRRVDKEIIVYRGDILKMPMPIDSNKKD